MNHGIAPAIMVLEDEAVVALELEMRLAKLGYRVLGPVTTYEDALRLAAVEPPSLLLADVRIVGPSDGIEVATELRRKYGVPTVFLSAHADPSTLQRIVDSSPFGYLTKPFREAELHGTIQTALLRARLERELAERERCLREAYRIGNLGHWTIDPGSSTASASDEVLDLLGIPRGEPASTNVPRLFEQILEADRETARAAYAQALSGSHEPWKCSFRANHPRRGLRHFRAFGELRPATGAQGPRVVGVLQDVTDLEVAEEERRAALRRLERTTSELEAIIAAFPDALVRLGGDGVVQHVQHGRFARESALEPWLSTPVPGRPLFDGRFAPLREPLEWALRDRRVVTTEFEFSEGDRTRTLEGRILPVEPEQALLILRDITERRESERLLREREEQLREAQRLESVGRLAGGIAHDFNNLLSVIVCTAALLEARVAGDADRAGLVGDILDASERASLLTQQLLAFSRQQVVDPRPIDVNERIVAFSHLMDRTLGPTIELQLQLCPAPVTVLMDPGQLEQVLLNLVVNARDAMPHGGRLEISTSVEPDPHATPDSCDFVRIRVRDEGDGIDADAIPRIFEPFFTTKEVGRGTGLGLATVHGIVHQAGGTIEVSSQKQQGTTFAIGLPTTRAQKHLVAATLDKKLPVRGERILVVDDDRSVRRLTSQLLERAGYRVSEAADGLEALTLFRREEHAYDALVADLIMPRLGGLPLAREIRRDAPTLPVLFLSGFGEDAEAVRAIGSVLLKPYTPERLYLAVQQTLAASRPE